jgi:hypothetical protein
MNASNINRVGDPGATAALVVKFLTITCAGVSTRAGMKILHHLSAPHDKGAGVLAFDWPAFDRPNQFAAQAPEAKVTRRLKSSLRVI